MSIVNWCPIDAKHALRSIEHPLQPIDEETIMATSAHADGVYRVIDVVGSSSTSWEEAAANAVETASKSLRDLRIAEVTKLDVKIENGKVLTYRTRLQLSFKYEG